MHRFLDIAYSLMNELLLWSAFNSCMMIRDKKIVTLGSYCFLQYNIGIFKFVKYLYLLLFIINSKDKQFYNK